MGNKLEGALAVLNGTIGDYLARTGNGLATTMECMWEGSALALERDALSRAYPRATSRIVVLVHGLMCTETVWNFPEGGDYGARLAEDFGFGPIYVRYNSGQPIADNGAALAHLLDALVLAYPVPIEEILLLGFSMGGLVVRSACHDASLHPGRWLPLVKRAIYIATPHLGAPYERFGRVIAKVLEAVNNPYTQLIADIANLRSAGLQDLGDANLRHEDRARPTGPRLSDWRHPVPLLPGMNHYLIAGTLSKEPWLAALFGDWVVPLKSAMAGAGETGEPLPPSHIRVIAGAPHMALAHHPEVYPCIRAWVEGTV